MTEPETMDPFETRLAARVRDYTEEATTRPIDALAVARTAISSERAAGWSTGGLGADVRGGRFAGARWAAAAVAVMLVSIVAIGVLGPTSRSGIGPQPTPSASSTAGPAAIASGPIPDVLLNSWQRPYAVTPGLDQWGSGFLTVASGSVDFGPEPGSAASRSAIMATGPDTLAVTATGETQGCAIGDVGTYRWSMEGKGTIMALTAVSPDACATREAELAGQWVRTEPPLPTEEATLPPGTYLTSAFDPFGRPGPSGQLSYTVPAGWKVKEDRPASFLLHHPSDGSQGEPPIDSFVALFTEPRVAAVYKDGAPCDPFSEDPGIGPKVDDLVAAIMARPGVVSTPPAPVTVGGYEGRMLDLSIAPSWTGGCQSPGGPIVGVPIIVGAGSGPSAGLDPDHPLRLILLDLTDGRTLAIAIVGFDPSQASSFEAQVAEAMPIIESLEFHQPKP